MPAGREDDGTGAGTIDRIADPAALEFGADRDAAWEKNLVTQAMEQVRARIEERQFQIFDLYVMKGWPTGRCRHDDGKFPSREFI